MAEVKFMPIPANIHLHHESLHTGVDLSYQASCPEHATLKFFVLVPGRGLSAVDTEIRQWDFRKMRQIIGWKIQGIL